MVLHLQSGSEESEGNEKKKEFFTQTHLIRIGWVLLALSWLVLVLWLGP